MGTTEKDIPSAISSDTPSNLETSKGSQPQRQFALLYKLHRFLDRRWNWLRVLKLRSSGALIQNPITVGRKVGVNLGFHEGRTGELSIAQGSVLSHGVQLECWGGSIDLDEGVFIGPYTVVYGHGGVKIGKNSLIAMHCAIVAANHPVPDKDSIIRTLPDIREPILIGEDVWLGAGVKVLAGVTIGDGCIVGAGAVVTEDLPPYSIALGVPAKVVGTR